MLYLLVKRNELRVLGSERDPKPREYQEVRFHRGVELPYGRRNENGSVYGGRERGRSPTAKRDNKYVRFERVLLLRKSFVGHWRLK